MRLRTVLLAVILATASLAPTLAAEPSPAGDSRKVMAAFYYWYRFVPDANGEPDPVRSEGMFAYDPASGIRTYSLQDAFPKYLDDDPASPYESMVDYRNPDWYQLEFRDMASAGVDIALMASYCYLPLCYYRDTPGASYAYTGAPIAADVIRKMQTAGEPAPRLAMLWEANAMNGWDLRQGFQESDYHESCEPGAFGYTPNAWAAWLQVREFFRALGSTNAERAAVWGTIDDRPVIVVYYGDGIRYTRDFWTWLSDRFQEEFGARPYLILADAWARDSEGQPTQPDAFFRWTAAAIGPVDLTPLYGGDRVVDLGPGYHSGRLPDRWQDSIRLREEGIRGPENPTGNFYDYSWQAAMAMDPKAILIESWNERPEGMSIARAPEWGDAYIRQTRRYANDFHKGVVVPRTTVLRYQDPIRRPQAEGAEFIGRRILSYVAAEDTVTTGQYLMNRQTSAATPESGGLWILRYLHNDGEVSYQEPYLLTRSDLTWSYIKVQVPDLWGVELPDNVAAKVRLTYIDDRTLLPEDGPADYADIFLEYDGWDDDPTDDPLQVTRWPLGGRFRQANLTGTDLRNTIREADGNLLVSSTGGTLPLLGSADDPKVRTIEWQVLRPRFGDRGDNGSDFRIAVRIPARTRFQPLRILSVELEVPSTEGFAGPTAADVGQAFRMAAGLEPSTPADRVRYNAVNGGPSYHVLDLGDVIDLAGQVYGATGGEAAGPSAR